MRRVLIIAPDFVPSSLPPALRIRFFANHLLEFGWEPTIITTNQKYYENPYDETNNQLLNPDVRVIRTSAIPSTVTRKIGFGDLGIRSLWHHWVALATLLQHEHFDMLFISVPPYYTMLLGRLAHARFRIPYVIDYIDPWVTDFYWKLPRNQRPRKWPLAYATSRILEPFAIRKAAHFTAVSKKTTDMVFENSPQFHSEDATEILYGIEPADFEYIRSHPCTNPIFNRDDGLIHLTYTGTFNPFMHAVANAIFDAIRLGLESDPTQFERIRFHFIGTTYAPKGDLDFQVMPLINAKGLSAYVDEHPARVSYLEALQIQIDSHILVAIGSDTQHYTASKIFPYLLSRRPILAVYREESNLVEILKENGAGEAITFNTTEPPALCVHVIFERLQSLLNTKDHPLPLAPPLLAAYTARTMAERLGGVFDKAVCQSAESF